MKLESKFIFTACQVGAEQYLKRELAREVPEVRFAFSRPGFVTFKNSTQEFQFDFALNSVFARAYGLSFGTFKRSELCQAIERARELCALREGNWFLHVWERDQGLPGDLPPDFVPGLFIKGIEEEVREKAGDLFQAGVRAKNLDGILHFIGLDSETVGLGVSLARSGSSIWPGGRIPIDEPQTPPPSRAYFKLAEALLFSQAPLQAGDTAVEAGSAPGGASFCLLERGLKVVGIDPAKMEKRVFAHPSFSQIQMPVGRVPREDLPEAVQWFLMDMNVEPRISLFAADRLVTRMRDSLMGVFLTVKLNHAKIADEIPYMIEHVKAMGMTRVKAAQLAQHRQEILIYGLTRRGMARRDVARAVSRSALVS